MHQRKLLSALGHNRCNQKEADEDSDELEDDDDDDDNDCDEDNDDESYVDRVRGLYVKPI
jgi:hypothetical protein